jgi:hypothetical protein
MAGIAPMVGMPLDAYCCTFGDIMNIVVTRPCSEKGGSLKNVVEASASRIRIIEMEGAVEMLTFPCQPDQAQIWRPEKLGEVARRKINISVFQINDSRLSHSEYSFKAA